jgi:hypothetical protein
MQNILKLISQTLDNLLSMALIHSFFLAIDLYNTNDEVFLGRTVTGHEFWRGLRGGGSAEVKAFRTYYL